MLKKSAFALAASIAILGASPAFSHTKLVSSTPADKATVAAPAEISIRFNEPLIQRVSAVKLTDARGGEIAVTIVPSTVPTDIVIRPNTPLAPGQYRATWTAAGEEDGHKMSGNLSFTVK